MSPPVTLKTCATHGCPTLTTERLCPDHKRQARKISDSQRPNAGMRGYDAEWQQIRKAYLQEHSYCGECGKRATEVDHITPLRDGGTNDAANLRSLCKKDHSRHTATHGGGFGNAKSVR